MTEATSTADWEALRTAIAGEVLLPGSVDYESARAPAMARYRDIAPAAVVRCQGPADVVEALALARRSGLEVAVRGGAHCFAGRSSTRGVLIDVGPMYGILVRDGVVTVGAGTSLGRIYDALEPTGRTLVAGCGPSVGIAGLTLGGGIGILGRRHGLTADQLLAAEVVLADGRVVWCDELEHGDLFWALRGAGGSRFGVVTSLMLSTVAAPEATSFELRWSPDLAATIIDAWQSWAPDADDTVAASLLVTVSANPEDPLLVRLFGAIQGSTAAARMVLDEFVARAEANPAQSTVEHLAYRETKRYLAEHDAGGVAKPEPGHLFAKSEFFRRSLPPETIAALVEHIAADRRDGHARELDFTPWGGAYNRVAPTATAFAHRAERFLLKHEVVVDASRADAATAPARAWLERSWDLTHAGGAGGAYPNFPDAALDQWDRAYHKGNRDRLLRIRARYDPDGVFS